MNWIKIGWELASLLFSALLSVVATVLLYRTYVAPDLTAALEEAVKTTKTIASLGGITRAQREGTAELARAVTKDIIMAKYPELEAIKMVVSPSTWTQIEDALENNPTGVMELVDKYGEYFGIEQASGQSQPTADF